MVLSHPQLVCPPNPIFSKFSQIWITCRKYVGFLATFIIWHSPKFCLGMYTVCMINIISLIHSHFNLFYLLKLVSLVIYLYCCNYITEQLCHPFLGGTDCKSFQYPPITSVTVLATHEILIEGMFHWIITFILYDWFVDSFGHTDGKQGFYIT